MSTGALAAIRETSRENATRQRRENRLRAFAINRKGIGASFHSPCSAATTKTLAETLKHKSQVTRGVLQELSQGLAANLENAQAFIAVQGSIHSLVTFLTDIRNDWLEYVRLFFKKFGSNATLQLEAAYCLANLTLWTEEPRCSKFVLQQASSYLVIFLSSPNPLLQQACVWVISNLLPEGFPTLAQQGFLSKLIELTQSPHDYVRRAVIECFIQLVSSSQLRLQEDELLKLCRSTLLLTKEFNRIEVEPLAWLSFHLTTSDPTRELLSQSNNLNQWLLQSFVLSAKDPSANALQQLIPLLRCIGNLCVVSHSFVEATLKFEGFVESVAALLKNPASSFLCQEVAWLIANIVNVPNAQLQQLISETRMKENLERYLVSLEHLLM